jgi:hypothetical protein
VQARKRVGPRDEAFDLLFLGEQDCICGRDCVLMPITPALKRQGEGEDDNPRFEKAASVSELQTAAGARGSTNDRTSAAERLTLTLAFA